MTSFATDVSPIVFDIETCGLLNAADYLEPVQAAKNLKDPDKIKADIEARTADRDAKLALDWNVGRIVALGWWTQSTGVTVRLCHTEIDERAAIVAFWQACRHRLLVGFNIKAFDLRFLVQRSRYLEIASPWVDLNKYSRKGVIDLFLDLTFSDGTHDQGAMRRTLYAFCRRFGIPVDDTTTGADIPALVTAGDWAAVAAHCESDVQLEVALARRLGVIPSVVEEAVAL